MNTNTKRKSEKGNVLFLILIAVALFAALSYVVTQSTRSGSGSTEREKNILSGAQMTQYPTALRTALIRMVLGGTPLELVKFNDPTAFGSVASTNHLVFHPNGGGAGFQDGDGTLSASGSSNLTWYFNANFQVPGIGVTETTGLSGNDIIAFLPGISNGICKQTNESLGLNLTSCTLAEAGIPEGAAALTQGDINETITDANPFNSSNAPGATLQGAGGGCEAFTRKASGCFREGAGLRRNVYFSVLMER